MFVDWGFEICDVVNECFDIVYLFIGEEGLILIIEIYGIFDEVD